MLPSILKQYNDLAAKLESLDAYKQSVMLSDLSSKDGLLALINGERDRVLKELSEMHDSIGNRIWATLRTMPIREAAQLYSALQYPDTALPDDVIVSATKTVEKFFGDIGSEALSIASNVRQLMYDVDFTDKGDLYDYRIEIQSALKSVVDWIESWRA